MYCKSWGDTTKTCDKRRFADRSPPPSSPPPTQGKLFLTVLPPHKPFPYPLTPISGRVEKLGQGGCSLVSFRVRFDVPICRYLRPVPFHWINFFHFLVPPFYPVPNYAPVQSPYRCWYSTAEVAEEGEPKKKNVCPCPNKLNENKKQTYLQPSAAQISSVYPHQSPIWETHTSCTHGKGSGAQKYTDRADSRQWHLFAGVLDVNRSSFLPRLVRLAKISVRPFISLSSLVAPTPQSGVACSILVPPPHILPPGGPPWEHVETEGVTQRREGVERVFSLSL